MKDGWENEFGCVRREQAMLEGYARSFSKASTLNWGSKANLGPTLRVIPRMNAVCHGIAFEFDNKQHDAVIEYLENREGNNFERRTVITILNDCEDIRADCFFYHGKNIIADDNLSAIAKMVLRAKGTSGTARDYLYNTKAVLDEMGIRDESVEVLYEMVRRMEST